MVCLRRWRIGHPLATAQAVHERLTKTVALAVFSSDVLSSVVISKEALVGCQGRGFTNGVQPDFAQFIAICRSRKNAIASGGTSWPHMQIILLIF
jgi:hypothetical protein